MEIILNNANLKFKKKNYSFSWYGIAESVLETFSSSYNADFVCRGLDYGDKSIAGIRFYCKSASTVKIYIGKLNDQDIYLFKTVTTSVGWNEVRFNKVLSKDTKVVLNGGGIAYSISVSTQIEYTPINSKTGVTQVSAPIVQNPSGTIPAVRILVAE